MSDPEYRRVEIALQKGAYRNLSTLAAHHDIAVVNLIRALVEAWEADPELQARVLPRALELDADSRKRRGGG